MDPTKYREDLHGQRVARRRFRCRACGKAIRFDKPEEHEACTAELLGRHARKWLRGRFPLVGKGEAKP